MAKLSGAKLAAKLRTTLDKLEKADLVNLIEDTCSDLRGEFDEMSERVQEGPRGEALEERITAFETIAEYIGQAIESLESAVMEAEEL